MAKNVPKNTPSQLLDELFNTVDVLGVDGTKRLLLNAREEHLHIKDEYVEFIINMTSEEMSMPVDEILSSDISNNKGMLALKFITFYLYESKRFSHETIAPLINKTKGMSWRYHKELKSYKDDPKHNYHRYFKVFDKKVSEFKSTQSK